MWYFDDEVWASTGGNTIKVPRQKIRGEHVIQPFADVDPAAWSVKERLELLDTMGVWGQILYPNGVGFSSNHVFAIENLDDRRLVLQIYNDFLGDVQEESGGRLFPQALLPIWDMDFTVEEMTRLIDRGIRGFTLSDKPEMIGLPELADPYFAPMWDLFNESGSVANFHIGSGASREELESSRSRNTLPSRPGDPERGIPAVAAPTWSSLPPQRRLAVHATQMYMSNVRIIANLCMSDVFDRFPKLKVVSAESGIGWVPFVLESLEYQFDEMVTQELDLNSAKRRPSEYFRDHLYVMFWFENVGAVKLIEDIGAENVLIETDIPHPTCLYPGAREHFGEVMAGHSEYVQRRVLQDNAAELYRIPLPPIEATLT
jgi:predicted TIM-barrel fold metal-dependent hydrolase